MRLAARCLFAFAMVLSAAIGSSGSSIAAPGDPRIFMAWRAPYGTPGALDTIDPTCPDSSRRDTLYLSFQPTQAETAFIGIGGDLMIYAQPGDTLGSFWDMGRGGANHGGMTAYFQHGEDMPEPNPWGNGVGNVMYERMGNSARIRFGEVMGMTAGQPIEMGKRYVVGRLVFYGRHAGLTGCDKPVCLEWRRGEFVLGQHRDIYVDYKRQSLVTRGPANGACPNQDGFQWAPARPGIPAPFPMQPDSAHSDGH